MKNKLGTIVLFISVFILTSCTTVQTYTGEKKPSSEVSILKGAWNEYIVTSVRGHVDTVDGKDVKGADNIEILPGKHEISVFLSNRNMGGLTFLGKPQTFNIVTEAGHVYIVDGNWNSRNNQIWIEDENTGKIIAGKKP